MTQLTDLTTHNIEKATLEVHNPDDNTRHVELKLKSPDGTIEVVGFGENITVEVDSE